MFFAILFLFVAYLIGSFPSALVIGKKFKGIDIREYGSKNLGSTNAIRVLGKKLGFLVFFLDVFKGSIVALITLLMYNVWNMDLNFNDFQAFDVVIFPPLYYGVAAAFGHMFPVFANFKGGKAVATCLGITLVFAPIPGLLCLVVFYIILKTTGYVSLASTGAILTVCITSLLQYLFEPLQILWYVGLDVVIFFAGISLVMIIRHRKNYIRIIKGTENSFKKKKVVEEKIEEEKNQPLS